MLEYIYLLREREFMRLKETTYKIGKTTQEPHKRFAAYPKGSEIIAFTAVPDASQAEALLIRNFKEFTKHMPEYGNEYFNCDRDEAIRLFTSTIQQLYQLVDEGVNEVPCASPNSPTGAISSDTEATFPSDDGTNTDDNTMLDDILTFGKYTGRTIYDIKIVDERYLRWLYSKVLTNPENHHSLIAQLEKNKIKPLPAPKKSRRINTDE